MTTQPPPWSPAPAPRRSRTSLVVALIAVLVAAIVVTTVLVINHNDPPTADDRGAPAVPTVTDTRDDRTTGTRTTDAPPTRQTTPDRTSPRTTAPRSTAAPRTTAPRTTAPRTTAPRTTAPRTTAPRTAAPQGAPPVGPRSVVALETNPLLQDPNAGLQNLVCNLPAWDSAPAAVERFFRAEVVCLDKAWAPQLEYQNMPTVSPRLAFPRGTSVRSPCGTVKIGIVIAAFYCEGTIYMPYEGLHTNRYGNDPGVYIALFAHEYGHHVQAEAGILEASDRRQAAVGWKSAAGLDMSRRLELQAQCFSGMFLGSHTDRGGTITREMYGNAWRDQERRGDTTSGTHDHGTNAHYAGWWRAGATKNRTAQCNTFAATAGDVS